MDWRKINAYCINCGQQLEAMPDQAKNIIVGCEPMKYRHVGGNHKCPPEIRYARPYSD